MKILIVAAVFATAVDCCDVRHQAYEEQAENAKVCVAKGGIPITEPLWDEGYHMFQILKQCAFPCDQRLAVEK